MNAPAPGVGVAALPWTGVALAVVGAIGFSGKAILAKLMYRYGVDAVTVVAWRMLLALPLFLLMAWWGGRGRTPLTARDWRIVAALGLTGYYLASMLDFYGLMYISASLERLILYLGPTIVMALSVLVLRKPVSGRQWVAAGVSYAGVVLVFGHEVGVQGPQALLGAALVFGSAVSYSVYLLASGEVVQRLGSMRLTGLASTVACGLCLLHFVVVRPLSALAVPEPVLWLSLLNATASTVLPVLATMMAIERIGATLSSQIGMVGPLSTIAMGVALLGEPFTAWVAAGTALVLAGITLLARSRQG